MISTFYRADKLALATLFQSKDPKRFHLNGVCIQSAGNDGAVAIATDGHRLGVFHDVAGFTCASCIVPLPKPAIDSVRKRKTRSFCWFGIVGEHDGFGRFEARIYDTTEGASELLEAQEQMHDPKDRGIIWNGVVDLMEGNLFPDWRPVIPKETTKTGQAASYNGKYLADFTTVARDAQEVPFVKVYANGTGPMLVTTSRNDFVGVLMPARDGESPLRDDMLKAYTPAWVHPA